MRIYNTDQLYEEFSLFEFDDEKMTVWDKLIKNMCDEIWMRIESKPPVLIDVTDLKEKWGKLRIYYKSEVCIDDIIDKYEKISGEICQLCGLPGRMVTEGWHRVLCPNCIESSKMV